MTKETAYKFLKDKAFTLVLFVLGAAGLFVWETFKEGADKKFNDRVIVVIKGEASTKYIREIYDEELKKALKDPFIWFDALNSDFVGNYTKEKAEEVQKQVEERLVSLDSIQKAWVNDVGDDLGIRNEDVIPLLKTLLKAFKEGKITSKRELETIRI